jgi:sialic acid synthase SpsE
MSNVRLVLDPGSTHGNSMANIEELITLCTDVHAALKFQLFENIPPNIATNRKFFEQACQLCKAPGMCEIFASVWDEPALDLVNKMGCSSVKFAYSQRYNTGLIQKALRSFERIYISYGWNDIIQEDPSIIPLYVIPEYPVLYKVDFSSIFPRFAGFSDHTIGYSQTVDAIKAGARVIEKHVHPTKCTECPDARFALSPSNVRGLNDIIAGLSRQNGTPIPSSTQTPGTKV